MSVVEPILRRDLQAFTEKCFYSANPGKKFLPNWHIDEICKTLLAVTDGKISRLVINLPPRYLKSLCVNVAWPAWLLGNDPSRRIISASYSQFLSSKHSIECRNIMQSWWYGNIFPNLKFTKDQNEKHKFLTTKRGFRFSTSVNGSVTGEGGDFLIVDDPISPNAVSSKRSRDEVLTWFDQTFSTRLDDKRKGVIVLVMQRLHEEDLSGVLLKRGWESLVIPAIGDDGKLLQEEREGWDEINYIKDVLGEYGFAAQYQQKPYKIENGLVKKKWLKYFGKEPDEILNIYQSWDTAIKTSSGADYSVGLTVAECVDGYYVLDCVRDKFEYPDLKRKLVEFADLYEVSAILVEDKASGQSLIQDLNRETQLPIIGLNPKLDKLTRFAAITPMIEAGKLFLPRYAKWRGEFEAEILSFPHSPHDDQADALSQFLNWKKNKNIEEARVRSL